tara:strand:+ start:102 stop:434 length:333 start_codon:yes stop_codon:yes gene_type:complete
MASAQDWAVNRELRKRLKEKEAEIARLREAFDRQLRKMEYHLRRAIDDKDHQREQKMMLLRKLRSHDLFLPDDYYVSDDEAYSDDNDDDVDEAMLFGDGDGDSDEADEDN